MIGRQELLTILKQALLEEERAIPVYLKHLRTAVYWTGIDKGDVEKIRDAMNILHKDSERHKETLRMLIDRVNIGEKDAY